MLVIFDLIQILKLALVSWRRLLFHYTPRDIRELTAPYKFEYHVVSVNLIFVVTIALVYSPIAPLVVFVSFIAMFLSYIVVSTSCLFEAHPSTSTSFSMSTSLARRVVDACGMSTSTACFSAFWPCSFS